MSRSLRLYCDDILISCDKILRYTQGLDYNSFFADELRFDGVIRNLQVIGEAVKQIPPDIRDKYSQIEWRKIAGLRDILVHVILITFFNLKRINHLFHHRPGLIIFLFWGFIYNIVGFLFKESPTFQYL